MALPVPSQLFDVDQRRVERDSIRVATRVRRKAPPHGPAEPAILRNISRYGFMVETALTAVDGSLIAVDLPYIGEVKARAIWSLGSGPGGQLGGEFLTAIDPYSYFDMLARINADQRPAG